MQTLQLHCTSHNARGCSINFRGTFDPIPNATMSYFVLQYDMVSGIKSLQQSNAHIILLSSWPVY